MTTQNGFGENFHMPHLPPAKKLKKSLNIKSNKLLRGNLIFSNFQFFNGGISFFQRISGVFFNEFSGHFSRAQFGGSLGEGIWIFQSIFGCIFAGPTGVFWGTILGDIFGVFSGACWEAF